MTELQAVQGGRKEASPTTLSDDAKRFAGTLARLAMSSEIAAARDSFKTATTAVEVERAMDGASFVIRLAGSPPPGPRVWLMPHLFGDLVLQLPDAFEVRIKATDVKSMLKWIQTGGEV